MPSRLAFDRRASGPIRIAVFNHKGGVGKTTLTVNIADALASMDKRVLLVDSDPQCNLTAYLVEESVVDDLLDNSDSDNGQTVWSALKPISDGTGELRLIEPLERLQNVYLLPGDVRLAEFEQELGPMWSECFQRKAKGFRATTALSQLVDQTARRLKIDFIFYDAGPNIGPLNRVILLDCDYFIVPAACDLFSIRAFKTLGHSLINWITDWQTILDLAPTGTYLLPGAPTFLGYVPQRFKTYGGDVSSSYARYLPRMERSIESDVVTLLKRIDPRLVVSKSGNYDLGQIKDFGTVANASQVEGVPIRHVKAGNPNQREEAASAFLALAKSIIERTLVGRK
jgi:cellulose biosynthesis protein BcsQ